MVCSLYVTETVKNPTRWVFHEIPEQVNTPQKCQGHEKQGNPDNCQKQETPKKT